jgi:tetratricopeptide (TPR) repeat protein
MRRLLQKLRARVERFVEQREDLVLFLACSDDDVALALKTVRDVEMADASDIFLFTAEPFDSARSFVAGAVLDLMNQCELASAALREEGRAALPALPSQLLDDAQPPSQRLRAAINFARGLLPPSGGHRLVWTLAPVRVDALHEYLDLLRTLLPRDEVEPWMCGLRLILRLPVSGSAPNLTAPRTSLERVDFSPGAMRQSLDEEADDEALPEAERVQALMTSAWLDSAHGEPRRAAEKFQYLLGYYQHAENPTMQAMVMHGLGDTHRLLGAMPDAQRWYECALETAVQAKTPVLIATTGWSLAGLAWEAGRYADAAQYYDGLHKIAGQLLDAEQRARALEWRGRCEEQLRRLPEAIATWDAACTLCRAVGMDALLKENLQHIIRGSESLGDLARAEVARRELGSIVEARA